MTNSTEGSGQMETDSITVLRAISRQQLGHDHNVDRMMGLPHAEIGELTDRSSTLVDILQLLSSLCGSLEEGCNWFFRSFEYQRIAGDLPCHLLEHGDYWAMEVLRDWLKIAFALMNDADFRLEDVFSCQTPRTLSWMDRHQNET